MQIFKNLNIVQVKKKCKFRIPSWVGGGEVDVKNPLKTTIYLKKNKQTKQT
jgi:hypothetical protein